MRSMINWGIVAVAAGLLAPAAWACGASQSASASGPTATPVKTVAARQTPANFTPAPRWSALAERGTANLAYRGSDQAPSPTLAAPGTGATGSRP